MEKGFKLWDTLTHHLYEMTKIPVERAMLEEISELDFIRRPTINNLHYSKQPLPKKVVNVILKWLPKLYEEHIGSGDHLIRALVFTEEDFDPGVIVDLFEHSNYNSSLKWTMAHVLSISRVGDVSRYIRQQLLDKPAIFERAGFISALEVNANFTNRAELMAFIQLIFDKYMPYESIWSLYRKYGLEEDLSFLEQRLQNADMKTLKLLEKTINRIRSRKRQPVFPAKNRFIT